MYVAAQRNHYGVVERLVASGCRLDESVFPDADKETGAAGVVNAAGDFVRTVRGRGGWEGHVDVLRRNQPRLGCHSKWVETNKLKLPKNFREMAGKMG